MITLEEAIDAVRTARPIFVCHHGDGCTDEPVPHVATALRLYPDKACVELDAIAGGSCLHGSANLADCHLDPLPVLTARRSRLDELRAVLDRKILAASPPINFTDGVPSEDHVRAMRDEEDEDGGILHDANAAAVDAAAAAEATPNALSEIAEPAAASEPAAS